MLKMPLNPNHPSIRSLANILSSAASSQLVYICSFFSYTFACCMFGDIAEGLAVS